MVALVITVAGNFISDWLRDVGVGWLATVASSPWLPIILLIVVFTILSWVESRRHAPITVPSIGAAADVPSTDQQGTRDELYRKWTEAEELAEEREDARRQAVEGSRKLRRALDMTITWLYRRANWDGLTSDGRYQEPAPAKIWADRKYAELGLSGVAYEPPERVEPEPGFSPANLSAPAPQREDAPEPAAQPDVPPGVAAVPARGRNAHLKAFRAERSELITQGGQLLDRLWNETSEHRLRSRRAGYEQQATSFVDAVQRHRNKWWSGLGIIEDARELAAAMNQEPSPAPGPAWRAAMSRRVEREVEWLKAHDARN
jgi:hypothetical protein